MTDRYRKMKLLPIGRASTGEELAAALRKEGMNKFTSVGRPVAASMRTNVRTVYVNDHDRAAHEAWKVLCAANRNADHQEFFFRYGDDLCRLEERKEGGLKAVPLDKKRMRYRLNQIANWKRKLEGQSDSVLTGAPNQLVDMVLATPDPPLPLLRRLVDTPVLTSKGTIADKPGYNADAQVFYTPAPGVKVPKVAREPNKGAVKRALTLILDEMMGNFPLKGEADKAHALCAFLAVRPRVG